MSEQTARASFVDWLRHNTNLVVLRHEDIFTAGHADISVTGYRRTLWIEAKWLRLEWQSNQQRYMMSRLAKSGLAVAVVFGPRVAQVLDPVTEREIMAVSGTTQLRLNESLGLYVRETLRRGETS